jgi:hypothetical protein
MNHTKHGGEAACGTFYRTTGPNNDNFAQLSPGFTRPQTRP